MTLDGGAASFLGEERADGDARILAFRRNVVVAASAGTGKTHRLTALYVLLTLGLTSMGQADDRIAAPPILPDRIVATTFSRAAAIEIARRIERALSALSTWDGEADISYAFTAEIRARAARTGLPSGELAGEIKKRASEALARWMSSRIDTLHGAARQIVQRHAFELGVAPGARVLDEDEAQSLCDLAVDEALTEALSAGGEPAQAARSLIVTCGGVATARREIARLFDRLDEEGITPRDLARSDHAALAAAELRELTRIAAQSAASGSRAFRDAAQALCAALSAVRPGDALPDSAIGPTIDLLTQRMPRAGKTPADDDLDAFRKKISGGRTHAEKALQLAAYLREGPRLRGREAHLLALLEDARARLLAARRRGGGLSFGDLLRAARDGVRDRPDIARSARGSIDALLVDEFQDTSRVQRDLVYLLRERDDAAAARRPGAAPRAEGLLQHGLFLVGDRKQSIYGFRGADVSVFSRVCAELAGRAAGEALALSSSAWPEDPIADFVALRESRRSGARVLSFVNAFASRDFSEDRPPGAEPRDFEITYGPAEHLIPAVEAPATEAPAAMTSAGPGEPKAEPPAVSEPTDTSEVVLITDDGSSPEDAPPIVKEATGSMREAVIAAAYVATLVRKSKAELDAYLASEASSAGATSTSSPPPRPTSFRDVAILARRRSSIPLIELALARLNVPYVVAGRALYDAPEVRDVAALLRLLIDPHDRLALATVLRGPMVALSDSALAILSPAGRGLTIPPLGRSAPALGAEAADKDAIAALAMLDPSDRARLEEFQARFGELRRAAPRLPPGEAIRAAVIALDYDRVLAALPRAEAKIGNVDRLIAIARQRGGSLSSFARWLDRRIRDDADEAEAAVFSPEDDAVRLTTIHASKGLDFPVVLIVDLNAQPRPTPAGISFAPKSESAPASLVVRHFARTPVRADRPDIFAADPAARELTPWIALASEALREAQADALLRDQAERRRLTYVAITRARRSLVLLGVQAAGQRGAAWRTLSGSLTDPTFAAVITRTEDASSLLSEACQIEASDALAAAPSGSEGAPATPESAPPASAAGAAPAAERGALAQAPPRPTIPGGAAYYIPTRSPARSLVMAAAPLSTFQGCPRRFRLRHLLGLAEPPLAQSQLGLFGGELSPDLPERDDDEADPRAPEAAPRRVLSRWPQDRWGAPTQPGEVLHRLIAEGMSGSSPEARSLAQGIARFLSGPYAAELAREGAFLLREEPFVLTINAPPQGRGAARALTLKGAIDLVAARKSGAIDVIGYKTSRPIADLKPHEIPLRSRALAIHRRYPDHPVRVGFVYLGSSAEPTWLQGQGEASALAPAEHARFEEDLAALTHRLADARHHDRYEGMPQETCRRLGCGFVSACHPDRKTSHAR